MPVICFAPQYVSEALLRADGFTEVRYVDTTVETQAEELGSGSLDFHLNLPLAHVIAVDRQLPITVVTGVHAGCYELFAHEGIRGIVDLKGKIVGGNARWLSLIAACVGLDPKRDLTLVDDFGTNVDVFAERKLDAYIAFPPQVQELHARKVGHVILRTAMDPPWSQYFCCMMATMRQISRRDKARHPRRPESRRSVREQPRSGGATDCRERLHRTLRICAADTDR
jgi:NitT/TauT family transport system substrate-binding protein